MPEAGARSSEAVEKSRRDERGYLFPVRVFSELEAERFRGCYMEYRAALAHRLKTLPARDQYQVGVDRYGHFDLTDPPAPGANSPEGALHSEAVRRMMKNLMPKDFRYGDRPSQ